MNRSWFDAKTGLLCLDEMVLDSPSFQKIMQDGAVTEAELIEQGLHVGKLFSELDKKLPAELHVLVGQALIELAVLHAVQINSLSQKDG